jgi:polynucleotide 5'-kinase involved in rRNA processing
VYTHQTSSNWESALTKLSQASKSDSGGQLETFQDDENRSMPLIAMVKGPKRSGKSTFAREAVNRLLER